MQDDISPLLQLIFKVLVSCRGVDGKGNTLAVAYCCNFDYDPPMMMIGTAPTGHSFKMIKETGCFVVYLLEKNRKNV